MGQDSFNVSVVCITVLSMPVIRKSMDRDVQPQLLEPLPSVQFAFHRRPIEFLGRALRSESNKLVGIIKRTEMTHSHDMATYCCVNVVIAFKVLR